MNVFFYKKEDEENFILQYETCRYNNIPRIGEKVIIENKWYLVEDIVKIEYGEATGKIGFVTNTFLRRKGYYSLVVFIGKGFQGSSKDDWILTYNDGVSPIPITTDILEKNGWRTQNRWYYYLDVAEGFISYIGIDFKHKSNKGHLYVEVDGNNMVEIQYCHELQHLLFGLGINHEMEV